MVAVSLISSSIESGSELYDALTRLGQQEPPALDFEDKQRQSGRDPACFEELDPALTIR